jgi:chromosome partitioning protein
LLIDTDKQESSLSWYGKRQAGAVKINAVSLAEPRALKKQVLDFCGMYDVLVIDGAPQMDLMATVSIMASDLIILPVAPSPYDIWATEAMVERIENAQAIDPEIKAFFLINCFSERTTISADTQKALEKLDLPLLKSKIGNRVVYADSAICGESVLEDKSNPKATAEITALYKEIMEHLA